MKTSKLLLVTILDDGTRIYVDSNCKKYYYENNSKDKIK